MIILNDLLDDLQLITLVIFIVLARTYDVDLRIVRYVGVAVGWLRCVLYMCTVPKNPNLTEIEEKPRSG